MRKKDKELDENLVKLGLHIRKLRRERGMTQKQVSELTGLSVSSISRIENGKQDPLFPVIALFALAFNLKISEFFKGFDEGNSNL